jgi:hypothetical protein
VNEVSHPKIEGVRIDRREDRQGRPARMDSRLARVLVCPQKKAGCRVNRNTSRKSPVATSIEPRLDWTSQPPLGSFTPAEVESRVSGFLEKKLGAKPGRKRRKRDD